MKDKASLKKIYWQYIIVDEGHRMKNAESKFAQTLGEIDIYLLHIHTCVDKHAYEMHHYLITGLFHLVSFTYRHYLSVQESNITHWDTTTEQPS